MESRRGLAQLELDIFSKKYINGIMKGVSSIGTSNFFKKKLLYNIYMGRLAQLVRVLA